MTKLLTALFLIFSLYGKGQSKDTIHLNDLNQSTIDSIQKELDKDIRIQVFNQGMKIYFLTKKVDSLIEAMRPKAAEGHSIDDAGTYTYPSDMPAPYSWYQTRGQALSFSGGTFGPDISGDTTGSAPTFTAYLIDVKAHTIAIDHLTKLPHVRPAHPVEGMLVEIKGRYQYFDGRGWVRLKEIK